MGEDSRGDTTMNIYVKIAIIGVIVFVAISTLMFAVPIILLISLGPETFIEVEPEIPIYGDCTVSWADNGYADVERYLMIPEQSCELICLDVHDTDARCQFESESISWDKIL